jgi:hypothetical protein
MVGILEMIINKIKTKENTNMKNLWPLIAQQRGVEFGEEFEYYGDKYKIIKYSLMMFFEASKQWTDCDYRILTRFINGDGEIKKLPRPYKNGDKFCYISLSGSIIKACWNNTESNLTLACMGNRFRTGSEALEHKQEILDKYEEALK